MKRVHWVLLIFLGLALAGCAGPSAIAREGWTLIDVFTTEDRRNFQSESVDVRNCGVPEHKSTSCSAGSSANFSVGAQAEAGAGAGVVLAQLDVGVGAGASFELGFDRSSGESLDLDMPEQGFVNRYWIEKEFRILSGRGRIQHKDGDMEDGVYTLQTGCFLRIERVESLTCEEASTPTPSPTSVPPTRTPTPIPIEPIAAPMPGTEQPAAGAVREIEGVTFVYVPAGEFTMGSEDGASDEKPVHRVYLDGYWIMRTEVTNAQYRKFIDEGGYTTERFWTTAGWKWRSENNILLPGVWNDSNFSGAQQPVVGVSWYEAVAYANWLTERAGLILRLPTEAEWEKAARSMDGRIYPWGNEDPNVHLLNYGYSVGRPMPVGSYPDGVSPYGVLDMAGNVWEWTSSLYVTYPYRADDGREVEAKDGSGLRVIRGGAYWSDGQGVRCASRDRLNAWGRLDSHGYRLATGLSR